VEIGGITVQLTGGGGAIIVDWFGAKQRLPIALRSTATATATATGTAVEEVNINLNVKSALMMGSASKNI
jgi:hypothetical protein